MFCDLAPRLAVKLSDSPTASQSDFRTNICTTRYFRDCLYSCLLSSGCRGFGFYLGFTVTTTMDCLFIRTVMSISYCWFCHRGPELAKIYSYVGYLMPSLRFHLISDSEKAPHNFLRWKDYLQTFPEFDPIELLKSSLRFYSLSVFIVFIFPQATLVPLWICILLSLIFQLSPGNRFFLNSILFG